MGTLGNSFMIRAPIWLLLFTALAATAAPEKSGAPRPSFRRFEYELTVQARVAGKGVVSEVDLKSHAAQLLKFLDGDPPSGSKLLVSITNEPGAYGPHEVAILAAHDNGLVAGGYIFVFQEKDGSLKRVVIFRGA
jgi:hypothetical protein